MGLVGGIPLVLESAAASLCSSPCTVVVQVWSLSALRVSITHFISFLACADVIGNVSEGVMRGVALFALLGWWYVDISPPSIRPRGGWGLGSKDGTGVIPKPLAPVCVFGVPWSSRGGDCGLGRALRGGGSGGVNSRDL